MYILIDRSLAVSLEEPMDFKRFHLEIRKASAELPAIRKAFESYGAIEDEAHAWVLIDALRAWSDTTRDPGYLAGLDGMLKFAKSKSWTSPDARSVEAHIVWRPDAAA